MEFQPSEEAKRAAEVRMKEVFQNIGSQTGELASEVADGDRAMLLLNSIIENAPQAILAALDMLIEHGDRGVVIGQALEEGMSIIPIPLQAIEPSDNFMSGLRQACLDSDASLIVFGVVTERLDSAYGILNVEKLREFAELKKQSGDNHFAVWESDISNLLPDE